MRQSAGQARDTRIRCGIAGIARIAHHVARTGSLDNVSVDPARACFFDAATEARLR